MKTMKLNKCRATCSKQNVYLGCVTKKNVTSVTN